MTLIYCLMLCQKGMYALSKQRCFTAPPISKCWNWELFSSCTKQQSDMLCAFSTNALLPQSQVLWHTQTEGCCLLCVTLSNHTVKEPNCHSGKRQIQLQQVSGRAALHWLYTYRSSVAKERLLTRNVPNRHLSRCRASESLCRPDVTRTAEPGHLLSDTVVTLGQEDDGLDRRRQGRSIQNRRLESGVKWF